MQRLARRLASSRLWARCRCRSRASGVSIATSKALCRSARLGSANSRDTNSCSQSRRPGLPAANSCPCSAARQQRRRYIFERVSSSKRHERVNVLHIHGQTVMWLLQPLPVSRIRIIVRAAIDRRCVQLENHIGALAPFQVGRLVEYPNIDGRITPGSHAARLALTADDGNCFHCFTLLAVILILPDRLTRSSPK